MLKCGVGVFVFMVMLVVVVGVALLSRFAACRREVAVMQDDHGLASAVFAVRWQSFFGCIDVWCGICG